MSCAGVELEDLLGLYPLQIQNYIIKVAIRKVGKMKHWKLFKPTHILRSWYNNLQQQMCEKLKSDVAKPQECSKNRCIADICKVDTNIGPHLTCYPYSVGTNPQ